MRLLHPSGKYCLENSPYWSDGKVYKGAFHRGIDVSSELDIDETTWRTIKVKRFPFLEAFLPQPPQPTTVSTPFPPTVNYRLHLDLPIIDYCLCVKSPPCYWLSPIFPSLIPKEVTFAPQHRPCPVAVFGLDIRWSFCQFHQVPALSRSIIFLSRFFPDGRLSPTSCRYETPSNWSLFGSDLP